MPTPDIDNIPESVDIPDVTTTSDAVPIPSDTVAPDPVDVPETAIDPDAPPPAAIPASSEVLSTGLQNPAPQIQKKQETLTAILQRLQNLTVGTFFAADTADTPDIAEQKTYFKAGLSIDVEADNAITAFAKVYAMDRFMGLDTSNLAKVYGVPIEHFQGTHRFKPQIKIIFKESVKNVEDLPLRNYYLEKEMSFPLLDSFIPDSEDKMTTLSNKIIDLFKGYEFTSTKDKVCNYNDNVNGFKFKVFAEKDNSRELIEKALSIQNIDFREELLLQSDFTPQTVVRKMTVLGQEVNEPKIGRWGILKLFKIEYHVKGIEPRILYNFVTDFASSLQP